MLLIQIAVKILVNEEEKTIEDDIDVITEDIAAARTSSKIESKLPATISTASEL